MLVTRWGDICSQDKRVCLSDRDLVYLLDTRREQRSTRNWRRLFPSVLFTCAESGLKEHQNWSLTPVEQLAVAMERSFLQFLLAQPLEVRMFLKTCTTGVIPTVVCT
ncbi:uncharacterized protein LOC101849309 isoform X5 [Aplysia californica]|uniref:Uncharacterized protein LOC101848448 isoform X3 n=1 Tax=Aplysia californica TaxID=6500 RepID=A0ABM1VXC9_APLCA|nr:uncharacterized protein LOC101848448 isoform X3 [Aplysia californica]XP_035827072.1 uncharacterized protein LOC101849309 isoform X5 [Aplysia californica]